MDSIGKYVFILTLVFSLILIELNAVTVNPSLCPTNKIAPHRRHAIWEHSRPRTFGLIYGLLAPRRPQQDEPHDDLQEQPQEDDPDDCGEIDDYDYDETDLSSVTPGAQKRKGDRDRYFFGNYYNMMPPYYPGANRPPPSMGHRPQRPTRPPYNFDGVYGSNFYRPPSYQYPSDYIKPVNEQYFDNPQAAYRPGLVGGNIGHIVGFPPVRPTTEPAPYRRPTSPNRYPESDTHNNRRPKKSQQNKSTSIIGSFYDLIFN